MVLGVWIKFYDVNDKVFFVCLGGSLVGLFMCMKVLFLELVVIFMVFVIMGVFFGNVDVIYYMCYDKVFIFSG